MISLERGANNISLSLAHVYVLVCTAHPPLFTNSPLPHARGPSACWYWEDMVAMGKLVYSFGTIFYTAV